MAGGRDRHPIQLSHVSLELLRKLLPYTTVLEPGPQTHVHKCLTSIWDAACKRHDLMMELIYSRTNVPFDVKLNVTSDPSKPDDISSRIVYCPSVGLVPM